MKVTERLSPNSEQLKSFVVIAECGNLSHAAERLCRTQSAISVQLRKLEESLNVSLFERQARGMALNANGKKLLPVAQRALAEMRQAGALFEEPLQGRIRVGIPDDFDDNILERALAGFSRNHPGVEIITHSGCTSGFRGDLEQGVLDVAVCSGPMCRAARFYRVSRLSGWRPRDWPWRPMMMFLWLCSTGNAGGATYPPRRWNSTGVRGRLCFKVRAFPA